MNIYTGTGTKLEMATKSDLENIKPSESGKKVPWDTVIHRGWISGAKENTIPAFFLTKENGYDWAECDVRFSSDGVAVLAHNMSIASEDGSTYLTVAESTVEQLKTLTLQTHATYGNITMPTLSELLDMARLIGLSILIDIKAGNAENMASLAHDVLSSGWADHVVYMPNGVANAAAIAAVDRNASFDFVTTVDSVDNLPDFAPYQALLTGANTVGFDFNVTQTDLGGGMDSAIFDAVRSAGLSVSFWNVRSSAYIKYMDQGPLRITKQNTADAIDLDSKYLETKTFW